MEKMKLKIDYSVYLVTDTGFLQGRDFAACIEAALKGGVTLLQYRDKNADSRVLLERALLLKKMCAVYHVPLLINDRLDIALAVQADGVHVGQSDLPVTVVRRLLGEQAVIAHRLITLKKPGKRLRMVLTIWAAVRCLAPLPKMMPVI